MIGLMSNKLFDALDLGSIHAANRLVMAPLTRLRAEMDGQPNELMVEYYSQRAGMGLIITEGTWPVIEGRTWYGQPGIETEAHQEGWARVADAVHARGGKIAMQVMHGGRVGHGEISTTGRVVAPSALANPMPVRIASGKVDSPVPHALEEAEIAQVITGFVAACRRSIDAGMDAVEIHGANGYLVSQFLSATTNLREDGYGGSPEKRARFAIELVQAVAAEVGPERTALRISPGSKVNGVDELDAADVRETYQALAEGIAPLGLAFLDVLHKEPGGELVQGIRKTVGVPLIGNTGFDVITTREEAVEMLGSGAADAVAVGRPVIANPDLARRWREGLEENAPDFDTFYTGGARGYTDYPCVPGAGA